MEELMQNQVNNPHDSQISDEEIKKIVQLSKLNLGEDELAALKQDFQNTLRLFQDLERKNVDTVEVRYDAHKLSQPRRRDVVEHDAEQQLQDTANTSPYFNRKSHYFDVPPVIETE
jgi:aspartyl/glutamyl-tRNA(Asn/Gln) amidotransferase C subunit